MVGQHCGPLSKMCVKKHYLQLMSIVLQYHSTCPKTKWKVFGNGFAILTLVITRRVSLNRQIANFEKLIDYKTLQQISEVWHVLMNVIGQFSNRFCGRDYFSLRTNSENECKINICESYSNKYWKYSSNVQLKSNWT